MANSIKTARKSKPADTQSDTRPNGWEKPYPEFPLSYHPASGRLYKKIRGTRHYFGYAAEWEKALEKFQIQRDDLFAGRTPRAVSGEGGMSVALLCDHFLNAKRRLLESGEINDRTFAEYHASCERLVQGLGGATPVSTVTPDDLGRFRASLARTRAAVTLNNEIQRCRSILKFGVDEGLIQPVRLGQSFNKASKKVIRIAKAASGPNMFEASDVQLLLDALDGKPVSVPGEDKPVTLSENPTLRAMVLLGLNAAFGSNDLALLPISAVDLKNGFVTFPRPKTGVARRAKLWPETVAAIQFVLAQRRQPADREDADLLFLTAKGKRWLRMNATGDDNLWTSRTDLIGNLFCKLTRRLGLTGRGFYSLRHTHQTVGEESGDFVAVRHVMGHTDASISAHYRERISDARLQAVALTVRKWLWPDK